MSVIEVVDIFNGERSKLNPEALVFSDNRTDDYILSIPHSGLFIPQEFLHKLNLGKGLYWDCEPFTDALFDTGRGIVVNTRINPKFLNVNRFKEGSNNPSFPQHLKQDPLSPLSLDEKEILREEYTDEERKKALWFYDRYHELLQNAIYKMKNKHDYALVIDCHGMNSVGLKTRPDEGQKRPDFVIGTLDDMSVHPKIISAFCDTLQKQCELHGLTMKKNDPFKGGFITRNYGKPYEKVHVIQVEVRKALFMQEGIDGHSTEDFTLNEEGLVKVNSILKSAIEAAAKVAKMGDYFEERS